MSSLPTRADIAGTPSNATAKAALAAQFDFVAQRLAAGTSGAGTASIAELLAARLSLGIVVPRGHISGCTLSTAGSSATMSVAAGQAADSTNAVLLDLASTSKTTSAWASGAAAGGLDTGTIANNTWYHFYLIRDPSTGVVDVVFSTSASSPTLPAGFTQYRRIGSGLTSGSAQWVKFTQKGNLFVWDVPVSDLNTASPGISAVLLALTVPAGVKVEAVYSAYVFVSAGQTTNSHLLATDPDTADTTPSGTLFDLAAFYPSSATSSYAVSGQLRTITDTSRQIRTRLDFATSTTLRISTKGWVDTRGANA